VSAEVIEYEREPVPASARLGFRNFIGQYAAEHTAGTELMIGPLFVAAGVSAFDLVMGLVVGNLLAVLSWTFMTAPIGAAVALKQRGLEPILQLTGRDRNRIAIQGDMLAAASLSIDNIVCMGGDPPDAGDHPEAKGVFDMDTFALLKAAHAMNEGTDMMGKALKGAPHFTIGAVANPGADDMAKEVARMGEKVGVPQRL
jgi:hypothetical protein